MIIFPGPWDPGHFQGSLQMQMKMLRRAPWPLRSQDACLCKHTGPKESCCPKLGDREKCCRQRSLCEERILSAIKPKWKAGCQTRMLTVSTLRIGFLTQRPATRELCLQPSLEQMGMADRNNYRLFRIPSQGKSVSVALKSSREVLDLYNSKGP